MNIFAVRLSLAVSVIYSWNELRKALQNVFNYNYSLWFTLITLSQYHFMFYLSRPLPNILALPFGKFGIKLFIIHTNCIKRIENFQYCWLLVSG